MPATQATTIAERREMIRLVEEGHTYASAADQVGVSFWTVRKWIRQAKRHGIEVWPVVTVVPERDHYLGLIPSSAMWSYG